MESIGNKFFSVRRDGARRLRTAVLYVLAACVLWQGGGAACAQRPLDSVQDLRQVDVVGRRRLSPADNPLTPMQSLSVQDLMRIQPLQLSDAVKCFAGVNVKDYGGVGGMKTVSVRSLGASHVAVSYDGVLLSDAQNGQIDLGKLTVFQLSGIALYNGQSADIFSPARNFASAALLQIENYGLSEFDSLKPFSFGFDFGSYRLLSPSFAFQKKIHQRFGISLKTKFEYVKGDYPFRLDVGGTSSAGTVRELRRENDDVRSGNAEVNLFFLPSDKHRLDLKLFYYGGERGLPGAVIYYYKACAQRLEDENFFGVLKHTWQINSAWTQRNILKYNFSYNRLCDSESLSSLPVDDRYRQNEVYLSSSTHYRTPLRGLSFSGAVDAAYNTLGSNLSDFAFPRRFSLWVNLAGKYTHPYVEVMASALFSGFFDRVQSGSRPGDKYRVSPFASVAVFPLGNRIWSLRAFYKDVFRMPTFNDLYYSQLGNTRLKPEKARQLNLGTTISFARMKRIWNVELSLDGYRNWVEDKIVAYPTSSLFIWSMLNLGKVDIKGVDAVFSAATALGSQGLAARFRFDLQGTYTFQQATDITDPMSRTYGHQVAYTPRHSGSVVLSFGFPYGTLSYRALFCGERFALNENTPENRLKPYVEHSLGLNFNFNIKSVPMEIGADLLNFTSEDYEVVINYPMPLINYRVHLRVSF